VNAKALADGFDELARAASSIARALRGSGLPVQLEQQQPRASRVVPTATEPNDGGGTQRDELTKTERKLLTAMAQLAKPSPLPMIGIVAGLSHTAGHVTKALADLRRADFIAGRNSALEITPYGLTALGPFPSLPEGPALFEYWCDYLGATCAKLLRGLRTPTGSRTLPIAELGKVAGLSATAGHVTKALAQLRRMDFLIGSNSALQLSPELCAALEPRISVFDRQSGRTIKVDRHGNKVSA
jgi:hypothetical protein